MMMTGSRKFDDQMRLADQVGAGVWTSRLSSWAREAIIPRQGGGG